MVMLGNGPNDTICVTVISVPACRPTGIRWRWGCKAVDSVVCISVITIRSETNTSQPVVSTLPVVQEVPLGDGEGAPGQEHLHCVVILGRRTGPGDR